MKLIPVEALIKNKSLLLIDDSIVRGTQLRETTEFLYSSGAKEVHIRPACPPLLFGCPYLNFSRRQVHAGIGFFLNTQSTVGVIKKCHLGYFIVDDGDILGRLLADHKKRGDRHVVSGSRESAAKFERRKL